jgi:GTP-binding protein
VFCDVDEEYTGVVVDKMTQRKAEMTDMRPSGAGKTRITFRAPSRGLIGYQGQFLTDTRGTGVMNRLFHSYGPYKGEMAGRHRGALISTDKGDAVAYAIFNLQDRGTMFIGHGDRVYEGMIVGENSRENDLDINVLKGKKLTNVRASGADEAVVLVPPRKMSLEDMMAYINDDELVEVTPKSLRLRKKFLSPTDREVAKKKANKEREAGAA